MTLETVRWILCAIIAGLGVVCAILNGYWKRQALQAAAENERRPSRVPFVAPLLGVVAGIVSPNASGWWFVPALTALDIGTLETVWLLYRMYRQRRGN